MSHQTLKTFNSGSKRDKKIKPIDAHFSLTSQLSEEYGSQEVCLSCTYNRAFRHKRGLYSIFFYNY